MEQEERARKEITTQYIEEYKKYLLKKERIKTGILALIGLVLITIGMVNV